MSNVVPLKSNCDLGRRRAKRYPAAGKVRVLCAYETVCFDAHLDNISAIGIGFYCPWALEAGEEVRVDLPQLGLPNARAVVRHAKNEGRLWFVGVELQDAIPHDLGLLAA